MKQNSIEEALEKLSTGKKMKNYDLLRTLIKEGIENFAITRKKYVDIVISEYRRLQKENELAKQSLIKNSNIADERNNLLLKNQELKEVIAKMAEYIASKDIDEDVCKKVGHGKYCEEYGENSNCKECVIEFFKGEVNK